MQNYVKPVILLREINMAYRTQTSGANLTANCDSFVDCPDQSTNSRLGVVDCSQSQIEIIVFLEGSELSEADFFSACQVSGISGLNFNDHNCNLTDAALACQNGFVYDFICDLADSCPPPDAAVVLSCDGYQTQGNCSVELN